MATIVDDDDRLLARIGYTPVSTARYLTRYRPTQLAGPTPAFLKMVHCVLRHIYPRCTGFGTCDVWSANEFGWTGHSSMGMVHW